MILNIWFSGLYYLSTQITGKYHHADFDLGLKPEPRALHVFGKYPPNWARSPALSFCSFGGSLKSELVVNTWRRKFVGKINIKREKAGSRRQPRRKNARDSSCWSKISSDTPTSISLCCVRMQAYSYNTEDSPKSESLTLVEMLAAWESELLGNCPLWLRLKTNAESKPYVVVLEDCAIY